MPRKETRNYSGSIFRREVRKDGKTVAVWDARKRYKNSDGANKEKFKRCRSKSEAQAALLNFENEIRFEPVLNELVELFTGVREKRIEFSEFQEKVLNINEIRLSKTQPLQKTGLQRKIQSERLQGGR